MNKAFELIVAMDQKRGIGKNGTLPWKLADDLKHFRDLTTTTQNPTSQNVVIMGRKTWESIPVKFRPLPKRLNIVLSKNPASSFPSGVQLFSSLDAALSSLQNSNSNIEKIFVIGGAQVFQAAISHPDCQAIELTQILQSFDCDTFFPAMDQNWTEISRTPVRKADSFAYYFSRFQRI